MSKALKVICIVLGLPRPVAALIIRMSAILEAMGANKGTFPSPTPALSVAQAHLDALQAAETATKTHASGTVQARDAAKALVIADANQLHGYVQQLANATPTQADIIATAAAMSLRKAPVRSKSDLAVKQTVSGTVVVAAKATTGSRSYEWQVSTDGGKTWLSSTLDRPIKQAENRAETRWQSIGGSWPTRG
jgi:hypothetical protein